MKRSSITIALYVLLVFAAGVAVGGFGHRFYTVKAVSATAKRKTPEEYRNAYMSEMKQRLALTEQQAGQIEKVLDETRDRYRAFREKTKPELDKIQERQTEAIRKILSAKQMSEYDQMRAEREQKKKLGGGGG